MWDLLLLIGEFCGVFLANIWCISWFSLEQQLLNFWNFSDLLIKVTNIFFLMQSIEMLFNFPPYDSLKNFAIIFSYRLMNLWIFFTCQIEKFCNTSLKANDKIYNLSPVINEHTSWVFSPMTRKRNEAKVCIKNYSMDHS